MVDTAADNAEAYRGRVMVNVLNAIVEAGKVDGSEQGMIELEVALDGVSDAIAMLVAAAGVDTSPKHRRDTADLCRKRILTSSNQIAARVAAGEELPWTLNAIGELN